MERKSERRRRRRRRTAERGSERIAFITSLHLNKVEDSPSSHILDAKSLPNRHERVGDEFSRETTSDLGSKEIPELSKRETDTDALRAPLVDIEDELPLSPANSRIHKVSSDRKPSLKRYGIHLNLYTPQEINYCMIASESTRVSCSIVISVLVVVSNINLPLNIVKSRSFIASNPLYVLLLADVAIVIGWLTVKRLRISEKIKEEEVSLKEDKDIWGGALKILEFGLVAHQTIRAIFIDFSFYAVIVICGLSLL